jgi:hypothetical protein
VKDVQTTVPEAASTQVTASVTDEAKKTRPSANTAWEALSECILGSSSAGAGQAGAGRCCERTSHCRKSSVPGDSVVKALRRLSCRKDGQPARTPPTRRTEARRHAAFPCMVDPHVELGARVGIGNALRCVPHRVASRTSRRKSNGFSERPRAGSLHSRHRYIRVRWSRGLRQR